MALPLSLITMEGICFGLPFFILWFISFLVSWQVALAWALAFFHFSLSAFICSRLLLLRVGRKNQSSFKIQFNALRA